ncbi:hypothetical protein GC105_09200 [Alkalibaculum sp. M08DMB]|uniref:Uncharacterized protein n=1 Tax=Alkalibaculum sporogenes TaxID=2655001 RepID=A0A6A7K996_9FIRM|nr:hypothetical protein [Alkalibaculum sporogenes]MPW25966.1 hypothetical protein [Alkalibaculum sporogenes]
MFHEINFGTVMISIILSIITAYIYIRLEFNKYLDLVDKQNQAFLCDIKNATIESIKNIVK